MYRFVSYSAYRLVELCCMYRRPGVLWDGYGRLKGEARQVGEVVGECESGI